MTRLFTNVQPGDTCEALLQVEFRRWGKYRRAWVNVSVHVLHSAETEGGIDLAITAPDDGPLIKIESVRPEESL